MQEEIGGAMMNYVFYDLELTCGKKYESIQPEIIEIGAVMLSGSGKVLGEFSTFVKPVVNPVLNEFCMDLTSIRQQDIDNAPGLASVMNYFDKWVGEGSLMLSWGTDQKHIRDNCKLVGITNKLCGVRTAYCNFSSVYAAHRGINKCSLEKALKKEGIETNGIRHKAIDDARDMARIFTTHLGLWRLNGFITGGFRE